MTRAYRALVPAAQAVLGLLAALLVVGLGVSSVRAHHEARRAREAVCAARVDALVARNPLLRKGWFPSADACVNLASLTGETR